MDKYDIANPGALQVPYDGCIRGTFDTLQIIDDLGIPNGKWGSVKHLEPLTQDYMRFAPRGATQAITNKSIQLDNLATLEKWLLAIRK